MDIKAFIRFFFISEKSIPLYKIVKALQGRV